jgi:hypothetical protein
MEQKYKNGDEEVKPDVYTYNFIASAWADSDRRDAPKRVEAIVERMRSAYELGNTAAKPNTRTFNLLLTAWKRYGSDRVILQKADALLRKMRERYEAGDQDVMPDISTYNSVIQLWSRSQRDDGPWRTQGMLDKMWQRYDDGENIKPTAQTYSSVIRAWVNNDLPKRAEMVLEQWRHRYESGDMDEGPGNFNIQIVQAALAARSS